MGANDNLTGCFISMAVVKYMQHHDIGFENTEVWVVLRLGGSGTSRRKRRSTKAHKDELGDVETVFIGLDTIRDYDFMAIHIRATSPVPSRTTRVRARLSKRLQKQNGLDMPYKSVFFGATDAAAVTQSGMRGCFDDSRNGSRPREIITRDSTPRIIST